jgi:hypothetical protein
MAWIGPDFGLVVAFTAALAVLVLAYGGSYKWQEGPILISAGIAVILVLARFVWRAPSIVMNRPGARAEFGRAAVGILRDWGPVILIMWLFQSLETYTGVIRKTSIDEYLYHADLALFGVEPTVWLSKHSTPLLTDYMALAYGSYFIVPMVLATMLSLRGRREDFREMTTCSRRDRPATTIRSSTAASIRRSCTRTSGCSSSSKARSTAPIRCGRARRSHRCTAASRCSR